MSRLPAGQRTLFIRRPRAQGTWAVMGRMKGIRSRGWPGDEHAGLGVARAAGMAAAAGGLGTSRRVASLAGLAAASRRLGVLGAGHDPAAAGATAAAGRSADPAAGAG